MKYLLLTLSLASSALFFTATAQAERPQPDRPCKTIVEACLSAGVVQKNASRQMMIESCVKPIVAGKKIAGINVDPFIIKACKAKMAAQG